ncbi:hypothetical protein KUCAC02_002164%2C partial [Scomber scombrus]|uniref:Uncharacterized protein n=1 Tax=Scomber scombrus TaxID=13677 RepID=A0AAV1PLW8_SCOSC
MMQWDITQLGSTRRATAKARTQPLRIYHPNKRPLPLGAMQEYIKLQRQQQVIAAGVLHARSLPEQEQKQKCS